MRLICGLLRLDGACAESRVLQAMATGMIRPGLHPHVSTHVDGPVGLAVLDFSGARSSVSYDPHSGVRLVGDVRLDQPGALALSLGLPSDADADAVLLRAYDKWGDLIASHAAGDLALAAWNPREQRLTCARDIVGARPLCYVRREGAFVAFASLPSGLHASGLWAPVPDPVALGCILLRSYPVDAQTGFTGIHWLKPGHVLTATREHASERRIWAPRPEAVGGWRGSPADAAEQLRALISAAVACRLPHAQSVGVHLSGGLDSSGVAVLAARQQRLSGQRTIAFSKLPQYSWGLDEREFINSVLAQEPDLEWHALHMSPLDGPGVIESNLPLAGPLAASDDAACALTADGGGQMVISGLGGDEGVSYNGRGLLADLLRDADWRSLRRQVPARATRLGVPVARVLGTDLLRPLLARLGVVASRDEAGGSRRTNALSLLPSGLAGQVEDHFPAVPSAGNTPHDRVSAWTTDMFSARADRWAILGARHGVAFTYPLADRRIIEFALSLPLNRLVDGGVTRQPFRNAMGGILPEAVRWRTTKFSAFPDIPMMLSMAAPGLLARASRLRASVQDASFVDLGRVESALAQIPGRAAATALMAGEGHLSFRTLPGPFKLGFHAARALILAEHEARVAGRLVT